MLRSIQAITHLPTSVSTPAQPRLPASGSLRSSLAVRGSQALQGSWARLHRSVTSPASLAEWGQSSFSRMKPSWRYTPASPAFLAEGWQAVLAPEQRRDPHPLPVLGAGAPPSHQPEPPVPPPMCLPASALCPRALPAGGTLPLSPASAAPVLGGPPDSDKCPDGGARLHPQHPACAPAVAVE